VLELSRINQVYENNSNIICSLKEVIGFTNLERNFNDKIRPNIEIEHVRIKMRRGHKN
jgi:hypothetical protein